MTLAKEWKDGVLSIIMRNMSKEWAPFGLHQDMKWVVLDGDIDAVWIESMNTVMDDNKVRHCYTPLQHQCLLHTSQSSLQLPVDASNVRAFTRLHGFCPRQNLFSANLCHIIDERISQRRTHQTLLDSRLFCLDCRTPTLRDNESSVTRVKWVSATDRGSMPLQSVFFCVRSS